ncbi:MAG: cation:dicarboxylase symporter family transporter [Alphaproteobacteria bacterium]|nr:cation:dicarboxylase symporter family transporter [Alphaproteobacteria bacterium]
MKILQQRLWLKILVGMALGALLGYALAPAGLAVVAENTAHHIGSWLALPGAVFLGLIGMVILPLVVCSIITGIAGSNDATFVKDLAIRLIPYFLLTSLIAVFIGLGTAHLIKPGLQNNEARAPVEIIAPETMIENPTIPERIQNIIPKNPIKAAVNLDLLQIVIASIIIGLACLAIPHATIEPFIKLCQAGQSISMKVIEWVMAIAPLAVFGMMADMAIKLGPEAFIGLGGYVLSVLLGLLTLLAFYLLIVFFVAGRNPFSFLSSVRAVQLLAFSTSSSAAVMPVTLQTAEERLNIHPDTARFVIPLGATINMDGTAMYQTAAAIFLCQFFGIDLTFTEMMLLAFTLVGASVGAPAMPSAGIVILAAIVAGLGVPPEGIGMILGVDRILDMCRTTVNVSGDLTAATVMERWLHRSNKQQS